MQTMKNIEKFVENKMVFCGIDVHKNHWNLCYYSDDQILEKCRIQGDWNKLQNHTSRQYSSARQVRFVYEAGFSGFYLQRKLTTSGYDCMITPPNRVPHLGNKVKTDKRDAQKLAQCLAGGFLKSVYVPPKSVEADRQLLRLRHRTQKKLTRVKNQIKSYLHLNGIFWPKGNGNKWTKRYLAWLSELTFENETDRFVLEEYLNEYRYLRTRIAILTRRLRAISSDKAYEAHYKRLKSCKGVGLITAMTYLLELYDLHRFASGEKLSSYLGMTPSQFSSGKHVRLGHITREGNSHVRRVLVESAWTVIRHDPMLKEKYDRIRAKGSNGKKAIVAVARSLALRLRACMLNEEPYGIGVC
jgi:transposase